MEMSLVALLGIIVGIFVEYWAHRLQHLQLFRPTVHALHHIANVTHGWLHEFWAYFRFGVVPIAFTGGLWYMLSVDAAIGWFIGTLGYMTFSAYTHELYHTDPNLVFWVKRPVHHFHHANRECGCNFAFTNTILDRIFGTYRDDPTWKATKVSLWRVFAIRWL